MSILHLRAICKPFTRKLSKVFIGVASFSIVACSVILAIDNTRRLHCKEVINFLDGKPVVLHVCNPINPHQKITHEQLQTELRWYLFGFSIGIVLPMIILLVTHVIMYLMLRRQARRMSQSSTVDHNQRLRKISRTFIVVVLAFYICVFPHFCMHMYEYYLKISKGVSVDDITHNYGHTHNIFTITTFFNRWLNPFIYSKLNKKSFFWMQMRVEEVKESTIKSFCKEWSWGKKYWMAKRDIERNFS